MAKLLQNPDGANHQARAVLAFLTAHDGIESSWSDERKCYLAEPEVDRWHNCREQGYVVTLRSRDYDRQLNVAFFEHRNSDAICAVKFEGVFLNPPTINDVPAGVYKDKYDTSFDVGYGEAAKMADWIWQQLCEFWDATAKPKSVKKLPA